MTTSLSKDDARAVARLTELADYVVPFTLRAICDLRIADHLAAGPRTVADLAQLTGTHPPTLERAMRALASKQIFAEVSPQVYALTPLAEPLRSDHPRSVRAAYPLLAPEIIGWSRLDHTLRTGEAAFDRAHGKGFWQYMAEHPEDSQRFDASQQAVTTRELRAVLPAYDWSQFRRILDVGGGNGAFLAGILAESPSTHGILFDQPHVVAHAHKILTTHNLEQRCEIIAGSFFDDTVLPTADAYLLKRVLYAWSDEHTLAILRQVRRSMADDGRLLLIEPLVEFGDSFSWGKLYDMLLVAMSGGGARSVNDLDRLFAQADLRITRITQTPMLPIVEARPAPHVREA
ncbi:methyltransferase [Micromonospora sediminicola]|uniref:methyltransferase n=1 Tax=Micromonospora sediminicola TaxID=946078 RepID=UPI0033ED0BC3